MPRLLKYSKFFLVLFALNFSNQIFAGDQDQIFVRAKAGPTFYSGVDPVTSGFGLGLDMGFIFPSGFGLVASGIINPQSSGYVYGGTSGTSSTSYLQSLFLGIGPTYSINKGIATISFGLGLGMLSTTAHSTTSDSTTSTTTASTTTSRLAIAPNVQVDLEIASGISGNIGIQYIAGFGDSPKPSMVSPMAGIGYKF